jgi:NAD(P)-dependent dehydrogenase (short-subunit alcohol dehydrogenase family)
VHTESPDVEFLPVTVDISDEGQVATAFKSVVNKFGRIDYAVNNAAMCFTLQNDSRVYDRRV